jgi:hypothetical protein
MGEELKAILSGLEDLDINTLTPLEALSYLQQLKEELLSAAAPCRPGAAPSGGAAESPPRRRFRREAPSREPDLFDS